MKQDRQDITERNKAETALKEKVEDLRRMATVVSDSNDAVIMHDLEGKILAWNRGAKETYGYTEAEALGMNVRDIVAEPDREAALRLIQKIKQGEIVKSFELRRVTKDGRILDVWLTTTLLTDEEGKPVAIATTERDITERNKAETALKEKVEDLRRMATVVSDSNDAVIMHDLEGKILAWNRGAKETYGYTEAEALGMNVRDIVAEPDREAALSLIQKIKQGEIVKSFELRRVTKDGRILDVWLTTTLLTDEKGKPVAIATTERDITERNKAEDEIKKSAERYRSTLDQMFEGCQSLGFDWRYLYLNAAAEKHNRRPNEELLGRKYMDMWPGVEDTEVFVVLQRCMEERITSRIENEFIFPDGRKGWFELNIQPVQEGVFILSQDITERKQAEAEHEKLEAQFRQAQKMEAVGRLAGGVAHDFNNMLQVIISYAELILGKLMPSDPLHAAVQQIMKAGRRSADLTGQLLAFARKQTIAPKVLDLNDTVAGMLKMLQRLIGEDIDLAFVPGR